MASSGKKKTTFAKLAREARLRERRLTKQAKKDARKQAPSESLDSTEGALSATTTEGAEQAPEQAALDTESPLPEGRPAAHDLTAEKAVKHLFPKEAADAVRYEAKEQRETAGAAGRAPEDDAEQPDVSAKEFALRRLREAPDEALSLFEGRLREGALAAGATEQELRDAQSGRQGHG